MPYVNKFQMTKKQAQFFAKKNLVNLVYATSKFEGTHATLPQTQTIVDGLGVSGIPTDEIITIVNLKRAWQFVIANEVPYSLAISNHINAIAAQDDSLDPGNIRTGNVMLDDTSYVPAIPDIDKVPERVSGVLDQGKSLTERLLNLLLVMMRDQFYWDGNKRTAFLTINYIAIPAGIGIITVNEEQLETFNNLLAPFYETGNGQNLKIWLYDNCIRGMKLS